METKNPNGDKGLTLEGQQATDDTLEVGKPEAPLDSNLENEYNKISEIAESSEETLAKLKKAQAKIEEIEYSINSTKNSINKIREELGLPPETENPPSVSHKVSFLEKLKNYVLNTTKTLTVVGVMFGASDAFSNTTSNPENFDKGKLEIKTEVGNFYNRLQEYNIISPSMTAKEFQEKAKDENWMKDIVEKYKEIRGIKSIPNGEVIKEIKYGLNIEEESSKKVLSQEERQKEIEEIWKDVSKRKSKIGDTVTLSDGSSYLIKKYKKYIPETSKQVEEGGNLADSQTKFEFLDKYTKEN